mmetsp:Transcript_30313/g.50364  ORF Transcript_30313/g.50364 Transcript_30313/m.50364 type:complete len:88 (+) Transcript_30313:229-492(+)
MPLSTSMSSNVTASSIVFIGRMLEEVGSSSKEQIGHNRIQNTSRYDNTSNKSDVIVSLLQDGAIGVVPPPAITILHNSAIFTNKSSI